MAIPWPGADQPCGTWIIHENTQGTVVFVVSFFLCLLLALQQPAIYDDLWNVLTYLILLLETFISERMYRGVVLVRVWLSKRICVCVCACRMYMIFRWLFLETHRKRMQFTWFWASALRAPETFHLSAPRSSQFCHKQRSALRTGIRIQLSTLH